MFVFKALLDTVEEIERDRSIAKEAGVWSSSKRITGADDRAGIAVLLQNIEYL